MKHHQSKIDPNAVRHLPGHTSFETAYIIQDYPYGRTLRCKKACWLEYKENKGWRFCYQTTNPKKAGEVWNAVKAGTYAPVAAEMYLDEKEHIGYSCLGDYDGSDPEKVLAFIERFPAGDFRVIRRLADAGLHYFPALRAGTIPNRYNISPEELDKRIEGWKKVAERT